jgi:hypothetical protein
MWHITRAPDSFENSAFSFYVPFWLLQTRKFINGFTNEMEENEKYIQEVRWKNKQFSTQL